MIKAVIFDMYETLITLLESPLYFGTQIAEDIGMDVADFLKEWNASEEAQTNGSVSLEEVLAIIMKKHECYSDKLLKKIVEKRVATKRDNFLHIHSEIIPMLTELKNRKIKVGLISNCFSEEAFVIRESILFPFFDAVYLSYEQGLAKPDKEIFRRCMEELRVMPYECIYIGDGGSQELETAEALGMKTFQALWYLRDDSLQPMKRNDAFLHLIAPTDIFRHI